MSQKELLKHLNDALQKEVAAVIKRKNITRGDFDEILKKQHRTSSPLCSIKKPLPSMQLSISKTKGLFEARDFLMLRTTTEWYREQG